VDKKKFKEEERGEFSVCCKYMQTVSPDQTEQAIHHKDNIYRSWAANLQSGR